MILINSFSERMDMAIQKCDGYNIFSWEWFYHLYPFTTENINGYIDYFNLKNNSLLTVGSSCDQALNAILKDVKDITILDINPFLKYYYYLKIAAILELDLGEYLLFLRFKDYPKVFKDNKEVFKIEIFNKIKLTLRLLDYESYLFWDELFQGYSSILVRQNLFFEDEYRNSIIKECNNYLNNELEYNKLKKKVTRIEPTFITGDIKDINLDNKYDNIWLSNIFSYNYSCDDIKKILDKFKNSLSYNGQILISYLYDMNLGIEYQDNWPIIYNINKILDYFKNNDIEIKTFTGIKGLLFEDENYKRDSVLIYKK